MTPRVVVLRALGLGDLLTGVPALRAVADAFPPDEHDLVLAAPAALAPLVELADLPFRLVDHTGLAPLLAGLRAPAVAVNLHGRGPQSHAVLAALRPGRLVAFAREGEGGPTWRADEHEVTRWCRMLAAHGIPADPTRLDLRRPEERSVAPECTILHPGAASEARRWPAERWVAVARAERRAGRRVVLTGTAGEAPRAHEIARAAGLEQRSVLAGTTDLRALAALVAAAARVVCGDTGIAHLATALRTPSVVLFGPTPPQLWGPPAGRCIHRVLWAGARAAGDPHAATPDPALLRIRPEHVLDQLAALDRLEHLAAA